MAENEDQTPQPPQRPPARHSAPAGSGNSAQYGGQGQPYPPSPETANPLASDPLFGQSPAPAPPPPPGQSAGPQGPPSGTPQPAQQAGPQQPYQQRPGQQPAAGPQHSAPQHRAAQQPAQQQPWPRQQPGPNQQAGPQQFTGQQPRPRQQPGPPQAGPQQPGQQMWGPQQPRPQQGGQPQHGRPQQPGQPYGQPQQPPVYQQGRPQPGHPSHGQQTGQPPYGQQTGQAPYGQQTGQAAYGERLPGVGEQKSAGKPPMDAGTKARLIGALVLVLAALATTGLSVGWIWNKADAVTPVALPSGNQAPIETISPSVQPSETPPPVGKVVGTEMVAANNDTMPIMSAAWTNYSDETGLWGGAAIWFTVHNNYDGKGHNWGNYAAFGQLAPDIPYSNTAAGLKEAAVQAGSRAIIGLYTKDVKILPGTTHKAITVNGHSGHELVAKVAVKQAGVKETFSIVMIAVIDRGNGTADVAVADIAGSTPAWQKVWRFKVSQITING